MTPVLAFVVALTVVVPSGGTSSPSPISSPAAVTAWLGVTLGESSKDVRSQLGKPREIVPSSVGDLWRFTTDGGNVTLELVVSNNQVVNIAARTNSGKQSTLADPFGAALGMSVQALQSIRGAPIATYDNGASVAYGQSAGVRWFYGIDGGVVSSIEMSKPLPPPPPPQVMSDAYRDGSTVTRAILVKAATESDGTNAELSFLHSQPCDPGGAWQVVGEELFNTAGRFFELFHVSCSTTHRTRDYYFDVTDGYGK